MANTDPIHLLLVEDNPYDAMLLRGMLRSQGRYEVTEATSLRDGREALAQHKHDVIMLDLSLPDSLGLETINKLNAAAPDTPIVVLTGVTDEDVAMDAVAHGAQDYLVKGRVDATLLARTIRYAIDRKRHETKLQEQSRALAESDRRKDEFLAMLAHELRNPLAPVRNSIHILRAVGAKTPIAQRQHEIIERQVSLIDRQITHMARLLDDLLDVSRITRGKIELRRQPVVLADVLIHVVETVSPLIRARHHTLTFDPPEDELRVEGDVDRLAQIVGNLLINAAKYTDEGGQLWLEAVREGGEAVIRVRDTGVGIAPEMLPHVFELFAQAERSLDRSQGGLGIGLTMVHKLVQLHGGSVEARSAGLGQGSEFIVRLPALPVETGADEQEPSPLEAQAAESSRCRVLVVDDVIDSAQSLAELLTLWGYETTIAHDGPAALQAAHECPAEVILLDIGLPGMDGYEIARRLRLEHPDRTMMLVAMTGYGQEQDREATRAAGFDHHLVKPVDLSALRQLLARASAVLREAHRPAECGMRGAQ